MWVKEFGCYLRAQICSSRPDSWYFKALDEWPSHMHKWTARYILHDLESFKPANNFWASLYTGIPAVDMFRIIKQNCFELPPFTWMWKRGWGRGRRLPFSLQRQAAASHKINKQKDEERLIKKLNSGKSSQESCSAGAMFSRCSLSLEASKAWSHTQPCLALVVFLLQIGLLSRNLQASYDSRSNLS